MAVNDNTELINVIVNENLECRICGEVGDTNGKLITPCDCGGSMSKIHVKCLQTWVDTRSHSDPMKCEVCHVEYDVVRKLVFRREQIFSCDSCGHLFEGMILFSCLLLMVSAAFLLQNSNTEEAKNVTTNEKVFLGILAAITLVMSLGAFNAVYKRWKIASTSLEITA